MLETKRHDSKLKLELMNDWKKRDTDADQNGAAAFLQVAEVKDELDKAAQKRDEFGDKLRGVEEESGRRPICLNNS